VDLVMNDCLTAAILPTRQKGIWNLMFFGYNKNTVTIEVPESTIELLHKITADKVADFRRFEQMDAAEAEAALPF